MYRYLLLLGLAAASVAFSLPVRSAESLASERDFGPARWIWAPEKRENQYVLFSKRVPVGAGPVRVRITASSYYELYLDGGFQSRGPVYGDPKWCLYDEVHYAPRSGQKEVEVAVVVHHAGAARPVNLIPAPGGLLASIASGDQVTGTDASWKCKTLEMWRSDVPRRGWALGYCEDYDAAKEPAGWSDKHFAVTQDWPNALAVANSDSIWGGYQLRPTPPLQRRLITPERFTAFNAPAPEPAANANLSDFEDKEGLTPVARDVSYSPAAMQMNAAAANAFTFDLGKERIGHYFLELEAPAGKSVEISGAELLREGRPWIFRKGTRYTVRYRTRAGRQRFTSFTWSGFRYLHVVVRGGMEEVKLLRVGCMERRAPLRLTSTFHTDDPRLQKVYDLCRYTLEVGTQEHLIDCPSREQAQYWGDALWIGESLWKGFADRRYMEWYLQGFVHVPLRKDGQISCVYPGEHQALLDYSLIPMLGQALYRKQAGRFYMPEETFAKAIRLKAWYDARRDADGLVTFPFEEYKKQGLVNFIDHPGLGWHNFPHRGIDREGTSAPLNLFYYGYVRTLAQLASELKKPEAAALESQATALRETIRKRFYDGSVLHDADKDGKRSDGTSWQSNSLAVYLDVLQGDEAPKAMHAMLDGYDRLSRCSPYFHFYFLPALRKAGMEKEARELIKREWGPMLDRDATTTWEGFLGDDKDSLCHPWSTAPFLFLTDAGRA